MPLDQWDYNSENSEISHIHFLEFGIQDRTGSDWCQLPLKNTEEDGEPKATLGITAAKELSVNVLDQNWTAFSHEKKRRTLKAFLSVKRGFTSLQSGFG